jgi:serine/threonine-protein kinase
VAVKVLGTWLYGDEEYARRFRREPALAARLSSPRIVPIHDYGEIDGADDQRHVDEQPPAGAGR